MNHHLEHSIIGSTRSVKEDCNLQSWLNISSRVEKGIDNPVTKENIDTLIDSTICNHPMRRYSSEQEDRPLVGMEEIRPRSYIGRHSLKITNNIDNKDYLIDCMSSKFREFIPNYSDKVPLGSVVAGIYHSDIEKAKTCHKNFIINKLKDLSSSLGWFKRDVIDYFKDEKGEKWQREYLDKDLSKIMYEISGIKMVAHFEIGDNITNITESIKNIKAINIKETENLKDTKEFKALEESFKKAMEFFENINDNKVTKKRKIKP